eukprot:TRINITY_DN13514_c0_g1_i1.p1 TRINITY_DN13514_c0_g1~~TRINITY_DN13514_c0_g1_i1.p1  ORF type:complete len:795 (-),score=182.38 TRINITY_DN13514_c0_g1_i1:48-2249(-)
MFNTNTCGLYRVLSCENRLCGVFLNPLDEFQLFTVAKNGVIELWNWKETKRISTYNIDKKIDCVIMHPKETKFYFSAEGFFVEVSIDAEGLQEPNVLFKVHNPSDIKTTNDGSFVAVLSESTVYLYDATKNKVLRFFNESETKQHSTIAIHPEGEFLLLGDLNGKIFLFDFQRKSILQLFQEPTLIAEIKTVRLVALTALHWHPSTITALCFNLDGNYFLSSSKEGVLVEWKTREYTKKFYPRFDDHIAFIQCPPNGYKYCVSLKYLNSIALISPNTDDKPSIIEGLKLDVYVDRDLSNPMHPHRYEGRFETKLTVDPFSKSLAISGNAGEIQLYDPIHEAHVLNVPIGTYSNIVQGAYGPVGLCHVHSVCFSEDGSNMASIDWRPHNDDQEITLKFWDRNQTTFSINTVVDNPHASKVNGLLYHPKQDLVLSFSEDGKFKLWGKIDVKESKAWICKLISSYQNLIPKAAAFSKDGSVIAIAFNENITLWDSTNLQFKQTLSFTNDEILGLSFVSDAILVSYTQNGLYVCDVVSSSLQWSYCANITAFNADLNNQNFAIAVDMSTEGHYSSNVILFSAFSPVPLNVWSSSRVVEDLIFLPEKNERGTSAIVCKILKQLLVLSEEKTGYKLEKDVPSAPKSLQKQKTIIQEKEQAREIINPNETLKSTHPLFNTASHAVPSIDSIFGPLMDTLMATKAKTTKQGKGDNSNKRVLDKQNKENGGGSTPKKVRQQK